MISTLLKARAALAVLLLTAFAVPASSQVNHLIISQLYGGGGNSGSVYSNDFVELYNPTANAVNLQTYSLQYAASTGTFSATNTLALQGTIQPGKYFLIQLAPGTNTPAALPTPDYAPTANVLNLSGTTGKVALVPSATTLASGCPTAAQVTDFVGWGAANCSYNDSTGANHAVATTNATGLYLNATNSWTGNNASDYAMGTPHPRNSTYGSAGTQLVIAGASANPTSVVVGSATTFTVNVTPGQSTTNTAVSLNLSSIGGSSTQALALTGTNTYSYTYTVPSTVAAGSYTVTATVTSSDPTATSTIALTVYPFAALTPISTIQASRATYVGGPVKVLGIITALTPSGFYMQTQSTRPGSTGDEGILIYNGTGNNPASAVVGNLVTVQGTLTLFPAATASHTPSLEVTNSFLTVNATGQTLPTAIVIPYLVPSATGGIYQLTQFESMLVRFQSLTATGPTDGTLTEASETVVSTGQFYAEPTFTPRPFREPGMDFRDFPTTTCPSVTNCTATATSAGVARPANLVLFDDNPERIIVESSLAGGTAADVSTGAVLTNVTGVLDFSYATDVPYGDPARLILLPGQITAANLTAGVTVQPLALPSARQVTVAAFNIERFFNTNAADNKYFDPVAQTAKTSSAVNLTAEAYNRRLAKLSLAIRNVLNTPDVVGLEEVENLSVIKDIAAKIDTDAVAAGKPAPGYVAYGTDSTTTYTDDIGGISVGFLVKPSTVNVTRWEQLGNNSTFTASTGTQTLNDRPSQVLHVGFRRTNATDYPTTLIVNHLRSLSGIGTSADTRLKKELQAEAVATAVQGYQTSGERVLYFGDMNAFEFSDGYTDTLGTLTGRVSPTGTAAQPGSAIVNPVATDLATLLPAADRRSYVEFGNAQILDHVVATSNVVANTSLAYAHLNADFPEILTNDATTPARTSDHDAALAYLTVPPPVISAALTGSGAFATPVILGTASVGQQIVLTNTGETTLTLTAITATGDFAQTGNCGSTLAVGATCQIVVTFKPTAVGARAGTLTVTSGAATLVTTALSGTGLPVPNFTLVANPTSATVTAGTAVQVALTLTPNATYSGAVTLSCTGLPANTSCDFGSGATGTVTLTAGGAAQTATLLIRTASLTNRAATERTPMEAATAPRLALALALPGMLLAGIGARRRTLGNARLLMLGLVLLSLGSLAGLTGCGSGKGPNYAASQSAAAGTYTVNVVATGATVTQTAPVTLTIQ